MGLACCLIPQHQLGTRRAGVHPCQHSMQAEGKSSLQVPHAKFNNHLYNERTLCAAHRWCWQTWRARSGWPSPHRRALRCARHSTSTARSAASSRRGRFSQTARKHSTSRLTQYRVTAKVQVVAALGEPGRRHIPFRATALTRALRGALGGACRTTLVACVWESPAHAAETLATCRRACSAVCGWLCAICRRACCGLPALHYALNNRARCPEFEVACTRC